MPDPRRDVDEVEERLKEIQRRKRGGVRWHVSKHTAEMAIGALGNAERPKPFGKSGKRRRRKRAKRLL